MKQPFKLLFVFIIIPKEVIIINYSYHFKYFKINFTTTLIALIVIKFRFIFKKTIIIKKEIRFINFPKNLNRIKFVNLLVDLLFHIIPD